MNITITQTGEEVQEIIKVFPAYQTLTDIRKISVLEAVQRWVADELKKIAASAEPELTNK